MKIVKKASYLSLCAVFSLAGMQAPKSIQAAAIRQNIAISNQNEFENIVSTVMPPISNPIPVEKGFGEKFDFAALLKSENTSNTVYKKRLVAFKHYLFDYIEGFQHLLGSQNEASGNSLKFLREYLHKIAVIKASADVLPFIYNLYDHKPEIVKNYMPKSAIPLGMRYIRTQLKYGEVAILPHIEQRAGQVMLSTKIPLFLLTEPDAESIAFAVSVLNTKNLTGKEKINLALNFLDEAKKVSEQGYFILNVFLFQACGQYLDEIMAKQNQKNKHEFKKEDLRAFYECPHLLKLAVLQQRVLQSPRNFLNRKDNGDIEFVEPKLFEELNKYVSSFEGLSKEYAIIYERVRQELKNLKKKPAKTEKIKEPEEKISLPLSIAPEASSPIIATKKEPIQNVRYAQRVLRWFKEGFARTQCHSSQLYHSLLPLTADSIVINYGEKAAYNNKTNKGQKDDLYSIPGKIINDSTKEESYCVFDVCMNPKGICYHRGFKRCNWDNLKPCMQEACNIEDVGCNDQEESVELTDDKPCIIRETKFSAVIKNPNFNHTIILYKKQI